MISCHVNRVRRMLQLHGTTRHLMFTLLAGGCWKFGLSICRLATEDSVRLELSLSVCVCVPDDGYGKYINYACVKLKIENCPVDFSCVAYACTCDTSHRARKGHSQLLVC